MKRDTKNDLARRYAQACVNVFGDQMQYKDCVALKEAAYFVASNRRLSAFLQMPIIAHHVKIEAFDRIAKAYMLPHWVMSLFDLLLEHKRTQLLESVLLAITLFYMQSVGIEAFTIASAYTLSDQQQKACSTFLSTTIHKKIIAEYVHDESLIAGIRMQSNESLWEHSIKKQLRELCHTVGLVEEDYES